MTWLKALQFKVLLFITFYVKKKKKKERKKKKENTPAQDFSDFFNNFQSYSSVSAVQALHLSCSSHTSREHSGLQEIQFFSVVKQMCRNMLYLKPYFEVYFWEYVHKNDAFPYTVLSDILDPYLPNLHISVFRFFAFYCWACKKQPEICKLKLNSSSFLHRYH